MNILLFSHEFPPMIGGAGTYTYELATGLTNNGHKVNIIAGKVIDSSEELEIKRVLNEKGIQISRYNWRNKSRLWFVFWAKIFNQYIKNNTSFDLIIFANYTANIIGSKVFDKLNIPYRIVLHGGDVDYFFTQPRLKDHIMFSKTKMKNYFFKAQTVISVSNFLQNKLLNYVPKLNNLKIVYHGIDLRKFSHKTIKKTKHELLTELGFNRNKRIIFTASRLVKGKGQDTLIRVFTSINKKMKDVILVIAGYGPDMARLKEIVVKNNIIDKVVFLGGLTREDVQTYYALSDVFVMISRLSETFGIVFIEAMAVGTPVIGSDIGGIPEVINNEINGLTVDPYNEEQIEKKIIKVLTDNEFSQKLITEGYKSVNNSFNYLRMAEETIN